MYSASSQEDVKALTTYFNEAAKRASGVSDTPMKFTGVETYPTKIVTERIDDGSGDDPYPDPYPNGMPKGEV